MYTHGNKTEKSLIYELRSGIIMICAVMVMLLLSLPASATVNPDAINDVIITPISPVAGDIVTIQGKTIANSDVVMELDFNCNIPVRYSRYEYTIKNLKVPFNTRFTVSAKPVENMDVSARYYFISLPSMTVNANSNGEAKLSRMIFPGTWTVKASGKAKPGATSVNLLAKSSSTIKTNTDGTFKITYNTNGLPKGQFNLNLKNSKGYTYQNSVTLR